ncbi:DMT family transporter [Williamsia serinedens]|uniref:Permease of the drug/metabolite transporter (DMT) superfamily n=1 Tax=Williamsia serinedens TaxID=391736 RepID=A0ABT1GYV2_9NOCA|nr:DMT family transporter [Williamsia serinedens]MCP2160169.1 Permease of the drug/metabolite transporter (DMT) superfamily [Williamsia serinedens]
MSRTQSTPATMSLGLAVPTVLLYAAGYPIGAATIAVMSPFLVILIRFAASAVLLWGVLAVRRVPLPPRRQLGHAAIAGVLTQGVQFLGCYWGLSHGVPAGLAALIVALNPVATSAIMMAALGHRESRWGVAALVLATVSVVLACAPSLVADHHLGVGIVAVIVGMLGLSVGGIHQGRRCVGMDPMLITAIGVTTSTPLAALVAVASPMHVTDWPRAGVLLVVMVVFSSIGATSLYAACIARSGPRAASILFAVIPSVAGVMAWIGLGEALSPLAVVGLVLGAVACVAQSRAGQPRAGSTASTTDSADRGHARTARATRPTSEAATSGSR